MLLLFSVSVKKKKTPCDLFCFVFLLIIWVPQFTIFCFKYILSYLSTQKRQPVSSQGDQLFIYFFFFILF